MPDLFVNVALLECADENALQDALKMGLDRYVVCQISKTAVVLDHESVDEVLRLLRRQGQTPKVTEE